MDKYQELFKLYNTHISDAEVKKALAAILNNTEANKSKEVYQLCFSLIDLTTLNVADNQENVRAMVNKVNQLKTNFPQIPEPAAICVYPNLVESVKSGLQKDIAIASVAGGFPSSQTFIEVKIAEISMALMEGADEMDVVLPVGKFQLEQYEEIEEEISEMKSACRNAHLKVILETGALQNASEIKKAALLAMASGADFIKTSTGKIDVSATPEAAYVMCSAIREWYEKTGVQVGFKVAGGISTVEDAMIYYTIVKEVLGKEWLNKNLFRIGASRLANNLLTAVEGKTINYF